jgi:enoyl-CoA hydratase
METPVPRKFIQIEMKDGVALLTIDRPESLNALNSQLIKELDSALHELEVDPVVKVLVLTGAGDKAFIAGGDIKEMLAMDISAARTFGRNGQQLVLYLENMSKPVIAAVNGYALGGGLELALACDFIYAAEAARLGLPEVTLGLLPGFGGTQNLARSIGPWRARELIFTGRVLSSREALDWGIINAVFPRKELLEKTLETATKIARNGSVAVASAKCSINQGLDLPATDGFRLENELFTSLFNTEDREEGLQAFLEKRDPVYKGH